MPLLAKNPKNNAIRDIMNAMPEINFGGGWGNHRSPEKMRRCFEEVVKNEFHAASRYSKTRGNEEFLQVVVDRLEEGIYGRKGIELTNIISGNGSTELAACLFKTLLQPGDAVLFSNPCYINYPVQANLEVINVNVKRFPVLDERLNFLPATNPKEFLASFERVIKVQKPRLVLIATPDNPTSQVWPPDIIEKMCEITLKHHVWFAMDLAYRSIYFGQKPSYFGLSFRDYENLITIHSFSKDFSLLGLRSSYIIAREDVIENLESVEGARSLSPVTLAQLALLKYFARSTSQEIDEYFDENRKRYLKASETMVSSLYKNIPTPIILTPTGGFYLVLNIANYGFRSDVEFAALLSQREKTAVVPGSVFGSASVGSLRLSYAPVVDQPNLINEGIKRLARILMKGV